MVLRKLSISVFDEINVSDNFLADLELLVELASVMMFVSAMAEGALCLARKRGII